MQREYKRITHPYHTSIKDHLDADKFAQKLFGGAETWDIVHRGYNGVTQIEHYDAYCVLNRQDFSRLVSYQAEPDTISLGRPRAC